MPSFSVLRDKLHEWSTVTLQLVSLDGNKEHRGLARDYLCQRDNLIVDVTKRCDTRCKRRGLPAKCRLLPNDCGNKDIARNVYCRFCYSR